MSGSGEAPGGGGGADLRTEQANERTLLAWIRTGLGFMAFGFVLARAQAWIRSLGAGTAAGASPDGGLVHWVGIGFVALGSLAIVVAGVEHVRIRRALREGRRAATGRFAPLMAALVAVLGLALMVMLIVRGG